MCCRGVFPKTGKTIIRHAALTNHLLGTPPMPVFRTLLSAAFLATGLTAMTHASAKSEVDPYLWLEEVEGGKALDWVKGQNARSEKALKTHPSYETNLAEATAILAAKDRIPMGSLQAGYVYNFWQDTPEKRGVWRRATLAEYLKPEPKWDVLLDIDALNAKENEKWVYKGADCLPPKFERCLVTLSRGGGDASVLREYDLKTRSFVKDGFFLPEAKFSASWLDIDTLMVGTDWGKGTLTESGYPRTTRVLKRGQKLEDAKMIFEGKASDVGIWGSASISPDGTVDRWISRSTDFFNSESYYVTADLKPVKLPLPEHVQIRGVHKRQALLTPQKDWTIGGLTLVPGTLVSTPLEAMVNNPTAEPKLTVLFAPDARTAIEGVSTAADRIYVSKLQNVKGRVDTYAFDGVKWSMGAIPLPDNGSVNVVSASEWDAEAFFQYTSFLVPDSLYLVKGDSAPKAFKTLPARFNADGLKVQQFEATSSDGEKIPYFLVSKEGAAADGNLPTLIYAYGGFQVSYAPWYWGTSGKLWLEKGGAYVVANIRGGGEFGPRWHEAVKGPAKRPLVFDDLAAVGKDLTARKISSPRRMGIMGGSNGGLLVSAVMVRNPTLFNAVVCQVPLIDMLRFHKLLAGASWIAEYGDPEKPEERALIEKWSPYQNLTKGVKYPTPFFVTSTKDDRVHPGHARKMAAKMDGYGMPFYYYENIEGGHSAAANLKQRAEQTALSFVYLRKQLME
jgi:prolyl oligopeptidase